MERTRAALAALACALTLLLGLALGRASPLAPARHAVSSVRPPAAHPAPSARPAAHPGRRIAFADRDRRIAKHCGADPAPCGDALLTAAVSPFAIVTSARAPAPDPRAASPRLASFARWAEARAPPRRA